VCRRRKAIAYVPGGAELKSGKMNAQAQFTEPAAGVSAKGAKCSSPGQRPGG
jgi:hypothetical protein